jgi:hypothetical protein
LIRWILSIPEGARLRGQATSGDAMTNIGLNEVLHGDNAKGLALMEQDPKKGGLKHPDRLWEAGN